MNVSRHVRWLVALSALAVVSCSAEDETNASTDGSDTTSSSAPPTSDTSTTTARAPPMFLEGDRYVALGSSIASGFGIPEQSTDCGRSSRSYPRLVAARFDLDLIDVTCGAAVIPNVVGTAQGSNPPQLDAVTADTKLITLSIGGNDIGYNVTALACGDPATICSAPPDVEANAATAQTALVDLIERLRVIAPSATIVLVTYPREVPAGNCPALRFTDEEASIVRALGERLASLLTEVAAETDVLLVDPYVEPGDHTGCAPESERWTAGRDAPDGFPYHPTTLGHEVMAEMILTHLQGDPGN